MFVRVPIVRACLCTALVWAPRFGPCELCALCALCGVLRDRSGRLWARVCAVRRGLDSVPLRAVASIPAAGASIPACWSVGTKVLGRWVPRRGLVLQYCSVTCCAVRLSRRTRSRPAVAPSPSAYCSGNCIARCIPPPSPLDRPMGAPGLRHTAHVSALPVSLGEADFKEYHKGSCGV